MIATCLRARDRWLGDRLPLWIFIVTTGVFVLTAAYSGSSGDVVTTNVASWQLAMGNRPYIGLFDFPALEAHPLRDVWVIRDADGREIIGRSGGPVLLAVPAYFVAVWMFGVESFSIVPGAITAGVATGAAMAFFAATVRPWLGTKNALLATFSLAFATPVWSVAANAVWPQTVTVLGLSAMAWAVSRDRWWLAGAFGGVAMWGRVQAAIVAAVVGVGVSVLRRDRRAAWRMGCISVGGLILLLSWNHWMYGSWSPAAYYNPDDIAKNAPTGYLDIRNQLGSWISPDRGILVWTPVLIVLLPVLARHWRETPVWSRSLAIGGISYTLLEATLIRFTGGDSFYGYRMTLELLMCLAPAVAIAARSMGRLAAALVPFLLVLQFLAITTGALNENLGLSTAHVWSQNSFAEVAFNDPWVGTATLCLVFAIAIVGSRIWTNPRIEAKRAETRGRPAEL